MIDNPADHSWPGAGMIAPNMATMTALEPSLVCAERLAPGHVGPLGEDEVRLILERGMTALTSNGVLGDPRKASPDKGEAYLERLADFLVEQIGR